MRDISANEHDVVALTVDIPIEGLVRGQVGTIVHVHPGSVFEVEFADEHGRMYALVPVRADQLMVLRYKPSKVA